MTEEATGKRRAPRKTLAFLTLLLLVSLLAFSRWHAWRQSVERTIVTEQAALRAEGYPVTPEELDAWYKLPDGEENAAPYYMTAIHNLPAYKQLPQEVKDVLKKLDKGELLKPGEPLPPETKQIMLDFVEMNSAVFDPLLEGTKRSYARYSCGLIDGLDMPSNHVSGLGQCCNLLMLASILHAEEGDASRAVEGVLAMIKVGDSLEGEPIPVSQASRCGFRRQALDLFRWIQARTPLTDEQMKEIGEALASVESHDTRYRGFVGVLVLDGHIAETPESYRALMSYSILTRADKLRIEIDGNGSIGRADYARLLIATHKLIKVIQLPVESRLAALGDVEGISKSTPSYFMMSSFVIPYLLDVIRYSVESTAYLRCGITALAVERYRLAHGELPPSLEALVPEFLVAVPQDPYDAQPLRYRLQEKGYVVYSVGANLRDDEGFSRDGLAKPRNRPGGLDVAFRMEK